jgi:hypothetical protein
MSEFRSEIGEQTETCNYAELGFEDSRTGKPRKAWELLRTLAETSGTIRVSPNGHGHWPKVEKRAQEIREFWRRYFQIASDPLPYATGAGYQARFRINCAPSFRT